MDPKDQKSALDEIMEKINAIQQEAQVVKSSRRILEEREKTGGQEKAGDAEGNSVIDQNLFEQVKKERKNAEILKEKSVIQRLIDGDEDDNEGEEPIFPSSSEPEEEKADIEDFESEEERDEIYRDLKNIVGKMAVKTFVLFLLSIASLYLFIAGFYPVLFAHQTDSIWFKGAFLAIDLLCTAVSFGIFAQGLARLLHARADTDTLLALLAAALIVVRIGGMVRPELFPSTMNLEPMLAIGLLFNVSAKKKIANNIKRNFKLISMNGDKMSVVVPPSCETNNALILETGEGGDVMYAHRTGLIAKYIEHSYSDFDWDYPIQRFLFVLAAAVAVLTVVISQLSGWENAFLFPAAALAISVPFFSRHYYAASIAQNGRKIRKNGGVLTSARSAKELEDADLMIISEEEFLGDNAVLLQGVKAMGEMQIDDLITNIAALFDNVGTPLKALFMKMIDRESVTLPRVDDVYYHEGMGYSCLIHSKMFLVGNRKLMEQFHISFPQSMMELNLKDSRFPVYVAYQKQPVGVFIVSFERNAQTELAVRLTEKEQVSIGIVTADFLFDRALLDKLYPTSYPGLFHLISVKTGAECRPFLKRRDKSPDLIASISGLRGLIACLYGASKLLDALKINGIIRVLYSVLSLALIFFIALTGYSANAALQILAFQTIWLLPICAICTFCK